MEIKYVHSESTVRPSSMEVGLTTVYLRRSIQQVTRQNPDGESFTMWEYEEAATPIEEYEKMPYEQASELVQENERNQKKAYREGVNSV